jgi:hypothetical protein
LRREAMLARDERLLNTTKRAPVSAVSVPTTVRSVSCRFL